jgi:hypothetical protein
MNDTLYFLTVLGVATLIGLLFSGCAYLIIFHLSLFAHVNLELNDWTQNANEYGEISLWGCWSISCKSHSATIVFCCLCLEGFGLQFSLIDLVQSLWFEIQGWDIRYGGDLWSCRFRTGVQNFVGARLGFGRFLDLDLLEGSFIFGILRCLGGSYFGMFSSKGWLFLFFLFLLSFLSFFLFFFFGSVELQGMCWDIWILVSLATPQYKHTQTWTVLYACPVLYILHLFVMSFIWFLGPQFAWEFYLQHSQLPSIDLIQADGSILQYKSCSL